MLAIGLAAIDSTIVATAIPQIVGDLGGFSKFPCVGVGAVLAGFAMASMTIGWPLAATYAPRPYMRIDFRPTAILGGFFTIGGCLLLALFVQEDSGLWRVAVAGFVLGIGMGFASVSTVVAIQSVVGWDRRGVVTGSNMFIRTLGGAVGVAVFGSIANTTLADRFRHPPAALAGRLPRAVDAASLSFSHRKETHAVVEYTRSALYDAVHYVFWALVVVAVAGLLAEFLLPRRATPLPSRADVGVPVRGDDSVNPNQPQSGLRIPSECGWGLWFQVGLPVATDCRQPRKEQSRGGRNVQA